MLLLAMRLFLILWEPTPVGDGLQGDAVEGVFHAHRPRGWAPTKKHAHAVQGDL
jgi:hypothetical protein